MPLVEYQRKQAIGETVLADNTVHIWLASLSATQTRLDRDFQLLDRQEISRSTRFHFPRDRRRFIVSHAILRHLLGAYLEIEPQEVVFTSDSYGKPALAFPVDERGIRFNMAHSGERVIYAVTCSRQVGVDLEQIRSDLAVETLAEQFFSAGEVAALRKMPIEGRVKGFFACWTRKEALLKGWGNGLSLSLNTVDVWDADGGTWEISDPAGNHWELKPIPVETGYAAAVAVEGRQIEMQCWQWGDDVEEGER